MKRFWAICWYLTAAVTWGGLIVSLPGYYLWYFAQAVRLGLSSQQIALSAANGIASLITALVSLSLGVLIFLRKRDDRGAWFVSFYLLVYGLVMAGPLENAEHFLTQEFGAIAFRVQAVVFTPLAILLLLVFPNGKITPSRFRWMVPLIILISLLFAVLPLNDVLSFYSARSQVLYGITGVLFLTALGGQIHRYLRKSSAVERQQTKIVVFGIGIQFLFLSISSAMYYQLSLEEQTSFLPEYLSGSLFWFLSLSILPIALTIAVIRSHLWDIDVVIRRTLIYGFLTAALALFYFGSVVLMQYGFRLVAGHESPVAIVISTLISAGLFTPLRGRIQAVIDRRFFRSKYNSEQTLARFQKSMRDRADLDEVESELTRTVQVTVQPEWMVLWVKKN